jgi:hypothetical protein
VYLPSKTRIEVNREGKGRGEEDVSSYWVTLRKRQGTRTGKSKHQIALPGEVGLEEAVDCRKTN